MPTATEELISSVTLNTTASEINFSSLPTTFTDLKLIFVGTGSGDLRFVLNNDTGNNYLVTDFRGDGTSASGNFRNTGANWYLNQFGSTPNTLPQFVEFNLFSYGNSLFKTCLYTQNQDQNSSSNSGVAKVVGTWRNTAAVTGLKITGTMYAGTTATLYGIL